MPNKYEDIGIITRKLSVENKKYVIAVANALFFSQKTDEDNQKLIKKKNAKSATGK